MKDTTIGILVYGAVGLGILGSIAFALSQPYFEAKAFNDCTGGHATYFTALFTELRVQDCSK